MDKIHIKGKDDIFTVEDWIELKRTIKNIGKIPALQEYTYAFIETIPDTVRHKDCFQIERTL